MDKEQIFQELITDLSKEKIIEKAKIDQEKPMGFLLTYIRDMYNLPKTAGWQIAEKVLEYYGIDNEACPICEKKKVGRRFKLTEEQFQKMKEISEGVEITASAGGNSSNVANVAQQAAQTAQTANVDTVKITDVNNKSNASGGSSVWEGRVITKRELQEARLKRLKENAVILTADQLFAKN